MQILTSVSHELRTPLGLIRGYLATLDEKRHLLSWAEQIEFTQIACEETETLTVLVENLLEMAHLKTVQPEPPQERHKIRLEELVNIAARNFVMTGRALLIQLEPNLPEIYVAPMQIVQASSKPREGTRFTILIPQNEIELPSDDGSKSLLTDLTSENAVQRLVEHQNIAEFIATLKKDSLDGKSGKPV